MVDRSIEARVRRICLALPEVTERLSHGARSFFVKRQFVMVWPNGHHEHAFAHLWCAAEPGEVALAIADDPKRCFRPPYVGQRGWLGMRLDGEVDWGAVEDACLAAWRVVAPTRLVGAMDGVSHERG